MIPVKENIAKYLKEFDNLDDDALGKMGGLAKAYNLKFNDIVKKVFIDFRKRKYYQLINFFHYVIELIIIIFYLF